MIEDERVRGTVARLQIDELDQRVDSGAVVFIFSKFQEQPVRDGLIPQG